MVAVTVVKDSKEAEADSVAADSAEVEDKHKEAQHAVGLPCYLAKTCARPKGTLRSAKNCDREHVKKTDVAKKKPDKNRASELRRQDSNVRPPGYEPGELPTAPLRDIIFFAGAKVILFFRICKFYDKIFEKSYISRRFPLLIQIKTLFLHTTQTMCNTKKHRREHHVDIKNKTTFG